MTTRPRILLVEDDAFHQKLITYQLTKSGYEVIGVADGQAALDYLQAVRLLPELILLDLFLPRRSGLEVLGYVKETFPTLPVVIMSAADWSFTQEGQPQADGYLTKPFPSEQLVQKIQATLLPMVC